MGVAIVGEQVGGMVQEGGMDGERLTPSIDDSEDMVERIKWMLTGKSGTEAGQVGGAGPRTPSYGDPTSLNTSRLILDSVGGSLLADLVECFVDLLGTSCSVYEKNGDHALSIFSSGWCRFMEQASRQRCDTPDDRAAMESGKWHCRESCWKDAALLSIETKRPVDVACRGGIRVFAVPICAGNEIFGGISVGYGDPPRNPAKLNELATLYGVSESDLRRRAEACDTRPAFIIETARKHVLSAARVIGEIVERKQAEQALRKSEEKFRALFDFAKDAVFILDLEGRILETNREACERLGYGEEEFLKMSAGDVDSPEQAAFFSERMETLLRQGHHLFESVHQRRDGTPIPVEISARVFESAGKRLLFSTCRDITERKQAESALAEGEKRFSVFMEHLPAGVFIKDQTGRVLFANRYLKELFDWQDCVGKTTEELVPPEVAERMIADDLKVLTEGPMVIQERLVDSHGAEHFFDTYKFPIDPGRSPALLGGVSVDVSQRKRAEEALEKRVLALTRPLDDVEGIAFEDLFSLPELQRLQDLFANVWGVAALITRPDGTPITQPSNFTYFCSEFIRKNEKGLRNCRISDATLGRHNPSGPIIHACLSAGLWGAGASITVGGRHIASWLIGQVRNEAQSEERIIEYARVIGADEAAFREAFARVPVMSRKTFEQVAHSLFALANQLSTTAYQNIQQARFIAERKRAEEALRESEEKFRGIYEASPIGIELYDREGILLDANRACFEIFGVSDATTVKGFNLFENPNLSDELKAQLRRGESVRYQIPFDFGRVSALRLYETTKTGIIHLDLLITSLRDVTKEFVIGYLVHVRDITEQKQAEDALRESEARYSAVVRQARDGVLILQDDFLQFANQSLGDILGYAHGEMENTPYLNYVAPESRVLVAERVKDRLEGKDIPQVYEAKLLRKDGTVIDAEISASLIQYHGRVADVGIIRDVTYRKRMEEERRKLEVQMREVQKLESLGILAGGIAHDFNNLLMAILGNADLAQLSLSPVSPARNHIEEIMRASHRAADLCRQMLAYSGKGRFVVSRHDISEIVREMGQMLDVTISKKAMMRYTLTEGLPAVEADATQMRQVVMNLITNASEALGEMRGVITITTGVMECDEAYLSESYLDDRLPGGAYVYLEVSDTGCGMDSEARTRIFDPFFTTKFTGRGLGLAAVLGIVRGHKGAIKVYSEVDKGTTFKVLLPASEWEPGERVMTAEESTRLHGGGTILLVDDEPFVRTVASAMLTQLGFQVLTADNGRQGVEVFRAHGPEITCVILDLMMPEMGGEETFRELRKLRSDIRVILSSGYNEQDVTQRFVGRGLSGFIQKPYTVASLRDALNRALG
jgi:PAS domain S-box-containing protein